MALKCLECRDKYARWHVWFKGFSSPTTPPFAPTNLCYITICDDCMIETVRNGKNGWQVEQITLINNNLLPKDDRALQV